MDASKNLKLKKDVFSRTRGGYSRWLLLLCAKCNAQLAVYQKDGPGILKRLYLDRIVKPVMSDAKNFTCTKCKTLMGILVIYEKEKRPAYRLFAGAVQKKLLKENQIDRIKF